MDLWRVSVAVTVAVQQSGGMRGLPNAECRRVVASDPYAASYLDADGGMGHLEAGGNHGGP